ncbi:hypothetical protein HDU93_004546, partial [Gonapodya sp. JEL0774]
LPRTQSRKSDAEKNPQYIFTEQKVFLKRAAPTPSTETSIVIQWKELVLLEHVGFGPVAEIWSARRGTEPVSVKQLACRKISKDLEDTFFTEARQVKSLRSPHLQRLFGVTKDIERITIVNQSSPYGSLADYIVDEYNDMSWERRWRFALSIAKGMAYLHRAGIVHGQLSSRNVLIDATENPIVADFGFSKTRTAVLELLGSYAVEEDYEKTIAWMAPEVLAGSPRTKQSDVYAFSIILWEIGMREHAYEGFTPTEIREGLSTSRLPLEPEWPHTFSTLIERCWSHYPDERPSFEHLVREIEQAYREPHVDAPPPTYSFSAGFPPLTRTRGSSKRGASFSKSTIGGGGTRSVRNSESKIKMRLSQVARPLSGRINSLS